MVESSGAFAGSMPPLEGARSIFLIATSSIEQHGYKAHRTASGTRFCQTWELGVQQRNIWLFETPVQEPPGGPTPLFSFEEPNNQTRS
jgi:hypothetical protein